MSNPKQHSIEQLGDALQRLINSHFNMQPMARTRIPAQRDDDDLMLSAALDELAALRTFRDSAIPLLGAAVSLAKTLNNLPYYDCGNHFPYGEDCYDLAVETEHEAATLLQEVKTGE